MLEFFHGFPRKGCAMILRRIALPIMLVMLSAASAFSATYYVDPAAGSDSNNGSSTDAAWQHVPGTLGVTGSGWVKIAAGDSVIVKGGSVLQNNSIQLDTNYYSGGQSGNLIKVLSGHLSGWGTGRAVVDGGATTSGTGGVAGYGKGFHIYGVSYIHIEGFEIRNMRNESNSAGVFIDGASTYDEIIGNLIHEIYGASGASGYGIEVTGSAKAAYIDIERNTIYHTEEKAIELYYQGNCMVRNNYIYQTNDHGMVVSSANNTITGNIITQAGYKWMTYESPFRPSFGMKFDGSSSIQADGNLLFNNLIFDCSSGIGILNGNNNKIYFNTVYHSGYMGGESGGYEGSAFTIEDDGTAGTNIPAGNDIRDNIFYYGNIINSNAPTVAFNIGIGANNTISRNVIYRDGANLATLVYYRDSSSSPSHWYPVSWLEGASGFAAISSGNVASNNVVMDPQFSGGVALALMSVLPTGFDESWHPATSAFSLSTLTPAQVAQGDNLGAPFNIDIAGRARSLYSLGAYEQSGTVIKPPAPPTGLRVK
jgi:hypothetical protein